MGLDGKRTFVGFGFGAIQAGLFLHEAFESGRFGRLVVSEVVPEMVRSVREARGSYSLNVARPDGLAKYDIGPIEIMDPAVAGEREKVIAAVALAEEMATAVPSVDNYVSSSQGSIHRLLAEGLRGKLRHDGPRCVVYVAENNNRAAEVLERAVMSEIPEGERDAVASRVRFVDTVIGKMSGVITSADEIREWGLSTITPGLPRAFLVEAFNRILISRIAFQGASFERGIEAFEEKDDLLPFCEAKLYGHNATHALAGYVGSLLGVERIIELKDREGMMDFLRNAFIKESGRALVSKHAGADTLFTSRGYQDYVDDLLARMTNPWLRDSVDRVTRGAERKLGWDDRLIGTIRMAMSQGVVPGRYAFGAAAALVTLDDSVVTNHHRGVSILESLWEKENAHLDGKSEVLELVTKALDALREWRAAGYPEIGAFLEGDTA